MVDTSGPTQPAPAPITITEQTVTDNLEDLLAALPPELSQRLIAEDDRNALLEIVLDLGRPPEARYIDREVRLSDRELTRDDLAHVAGRIGRFGDDNRAGIERTLHRISAIRNRRGDIVGLTCRIGRAVYGTITIVQDLIEDGNSLLLVGKPGVGKTTLLREAARVLADDLRKRVVVVDTSNEIAGDGDIPHPSIGRARRMQVATPTAQHAVMIEAVENHMPEVIVIDEIGTELEAAAARTIAERGVQLIGTAHGNTQANLMLNPTLSDLIGGIQSVTLSDEEARRRGTQKSILERKAPPTFSVMVEIRDRRQVAVHHDVAATVDSILRGVPLPAEIRTRLDDGRVVIEQEDADGRDLDEFQQIRRSGPALAASRARTTGRRAPGDGRGRAGDERSRPAAATPARPVAAATTARASAAPVPSPTTARPARTVRIYPFGVSRNRIESAIRQLAVPAELVRDSHEADLVLTLKTYYRRRPPAVTDAEAAGVPIYVLRANTSTQIEQVLAGHFQVAPHAIATTETEDGGAADSAVLAAMEEAEQAIHDVLHRGQAIELAPQTSYIRRLQHALADRYNLASRSRGHEPNRRVLISRTGGEP
ncbi:MAG: AAA family ATPase [Chloroflexi bacterium]|nr:AAA family ATPase [Chloroflexota bacterium]